MDAGLKLHPLLSKSERKAFVRAVREPLGKGVARVTDPNAQSQARKSTVSALKSVGTKRKSKSADVGVTSSAATSDDEGRMVMGRTSDGDAEMTAETGDGLVAHATEHVRRRRFGAD